MTNIVHWRDIVGEKFMPKFLAIEKGILYDDKKNIGEVESIKRALEKKSITEEDVEDWRKKHHYISFSGYETKAPGMWTHHGWFKSYLDGKDVKFYCTAPPEQRKYITLSAFLDWKKGMDQEGLEADYYGETKNIIEDIGKNHNGSGNSRSHVLKSYKGDEFIPELPDA